MSTVAKHIQDRQAEPKKKVQSVVRHKTGITFGEKILLVVFALLVAGAGIKVIANQSAIYSVNRDIQLVEGSIEDQKKVNGDLKVQVSELSTYERIWKKAAELGLKLNQNNVKVVQD
ncbi:cell division protein FtsL [Peribacillus deserti]|uniref:Cell division protein FtsL n=1 Tax=Peribacillus deserti TaxID=673318 RepID=A0ABS2QHT0_9BACI|nr:cell division protein FtsL [Peribacillus deserti]MBM7692369.1 cell division protein FtsL [Peribacillus deserti]